MPAGLFRIQLRDGGGRIARGDAQTGPEELLPVEWTLDELLSSDGPRLADAITAPSDGALPQGARVLAPVQGQEVWAAGVTYLRSREARVEESADRTPYDAAYDAERPELFFKAPGWRVRGPREEVAVRADSPWNTPEPELALVLDHAMSVAGYTIGNDVSSRSIEGENPLYLPQAKVYDGACAIGPCIVPVGEVDPPFTIDLEVVRAGRVAYHGTTSTERMARTFDELASYLGRALSFPAGAVLLTGTGLVPDAPFSLEAGDSVRIAIEGLGVLENAVGVVGFTTSASSAKAVTA
jgi:2-dehydro-3-deoxy-D-arabinonate dehydratase